MALRPKFAEIGDTATAIDAAIAGRRSLRGFRPTPVPRALVEHILAIARWAPSGTNMQPWRVYVLTGAARRRLTDAIVKVREQDPDGHERAYKYYPAEFPDLYLKRRRKVGWDLYGLLDIAKGDKAAMRRQHSRNFEFFGAPVGMIFTIDERLEIGSWLDYGMFLQNIMVAARGHGLETCPQAAFATYHEVIRDVLGVGADEVVVCGMSLGYPDESAPANRLETERAELEEFVTFIED